MSRHFRHDMPFGAHVRGDGVRFRLYAPAASRVEVVFDAETRERRSPLQALGGGWFEATVTEARVGTRYAFVLDGADGRVPDPASRFQPEGVHGPSEVIDPQSFAWPDDAWQGRPWNEHVFYELHLGTFTPEGTYAAAREKLAHLVELGVTALELMPLAEVPGARNWGYDGVLPYAPTRNYGSPDELKAFIADAHGHGLAVYLDVVYNHFGPEGNYLHGYAPTFYTERHKTPWGAAIDVEAPDRDDVRAYFIENALYWTQEYRFDGLRFDAVHAIYDGADRHFLRELARTVGERSDRPVHLVLENELNEAPLLEAGFRAQWDDDEHHVMHVLATNERDGYYADYAKDTVARFGRTLTQGFAYQGEFSEHAGKLRGTPSGALPLGDFVTFLQNHDQIGNRPFGDRITAVAPDFAIRAILATFLLAPSPPLLFMGEEWGASTPFQFFCDFEPELAKAVTEGRRSEFGSFAAFSDPEQRDRIPDPSAAETFERSKLDWGERAREPHRSWLAYYRRLLAIRRDEIAPRIADIAGSDASFETIGARGLSARYRLRDDTTLVLEANFGNSAQAGFRSRPSGYVVFATHDPAYSDTIAPPVERSVDARLKQITDSPVSTYRLQFTPSFRFEDARKIVPYLADLGIGYLYASPYLKARPGSEHGYDVVDPNKLNPEIGTPEEHAALIDASQAAGIGHLLDFVPNHMGIGVENPWWQDVLEWGESSPYGEFFDIDWYPLRSEMRGKVLVPSLGDYYGRVLERGELKLAFDAAAGTISVAYFENRFPLATKSYGQLLALAAEKLPGEAWALRALAAEFDVASRDRALELKTELTGVAKDAATQAAIEAALRAYDPKENAAAIDKLDGLLQQQHFRLAYWRVSADEINYRRFFDVNDLAGVRVEDAEVLAQTHRFVFELIASGRIQGLRIDHVDGLYTPGGYCELLQDRAAALGHPQYLVVEKILARFEHLRKDWRIAGTTGYDFMNLVNGVFIDGKAESAFDRLYRQFAGISGTFEQFANRAKKDIMRTSLASELEVLATMLDRLARLDRRSNDYTFNVLRDALVETVASFPVYRTYVTSEQVEEDDRRFIDWALGSARKRSDLGDERVFDFIESLLTMRASEVSPNYDRRQVLRFAMKFQQYTSPVMAKAVEDTAFYRYVRLVSLNEVGGDPRRFGTSVAAFHRANAERALDFPTAMLATATHDHKRGEDTRTRIDALSEMPGLWDRTIKRWGRLNARRKVSVDDAAAPTDNDEYLIYQILLGTWPAEWLALETFDDEELETYLARIEAYLRKALREAKFRTSWTNPNEAYEAAAIGFARNILAAQRSAPFVRELRAFARECATLGALSSLAQVTLKLTSPGVPDIYQGCELWDLSLVDPDNRRPVDYDARHAAIGDMKARVERGEAAALASELLRTWADGRVKLYVTWRLLRLRREDPAYAGSDYAPLETTGTRADHIVAFARGRVLTIVPRLVRTVFERRDGMPSLVYRGGEAIRLRPEDAARFVDRFTGRTFEARRDKDGTYLDAAELLGTFPVAVLLPADGS